MATAKDIRPKKLTAKQTETLKAVLVDEMNKLIFNGIYLSDEFNVDSEDLSDDVDYANSTLRSAQRLRFRNREVFYANKISKALERIELGTYGLCPECDCPIGYKRLSARPTADLCINCKEESEKTELSSVLGQVSKSYDVSRARTQD